LVSFRSFSASLCENTDVHSEEGRLAIVLSQPTALLWFVLGAPREREVIGQGGEQMERASHDPRLFPQNDFIAAPRDFYFLALQTKLLRQAHCLAVSRAKDFCGRHISTPFGNRDELAGDAGACLQRRALYIQAAWTIHGPWETGKSQSF